MVDGIYIERMPLRSCATDGESIAVLCSHTIVVKDSSIGFCCQEYILLYTTAVGSSCVNGAVI